MNSTDEASRIAGLEAEVARLQGRVTELSAAGSANNDFELLVSMVPAFLCRLDAEFRIRYLNRYEPGHAESDVLGTSIFEYIAPDHHAVARECIEGVLETGQPGSYRVRAESSPGVGAYYHTLVSRLPDDRGAPGVFLVSMDVTERRDLEDQLKQAQRMEAVGNLTAGIAHNFNNLLMAILPSLELLRPSVPDESLPLLDDASHAGERAAELIRQLMTYAGQRQMPRPYVQPIGPILDAALAICRRTFDRQIAIDARIAPGLPAIRADAGALEQVFMNVLVNARDAVLSKTGGAPRIEVVADLVDESVRVAIRDNGDGITTDAQARIFEPFFTTKGVGVGTGLGLATSFAIMREHQGTIECVSAGGGGATFVISLPPARREADEETKRPSSIPDMPASRVLLVDDERVVRAVVSRILENSGHEVLLASSAEEALSVLEDMTDVHVVLLDRSMPGGLGDSLIPHIRSASPAAKILFFTGQEVEEPHLEAVDGIVQKPVNATGLLAAIAAVLQV